MEYTKICNHHYAATYRTPGLGSQCPYSEFYSKLQSTESSSSVIGDTLSLPNDDNGACIFHSRPLAWKRQNHFVERFLQLDRLLDEYHPERYYDFAEFVFVGNDLVTRNGPESYLLRITDAIFNKQPYFAGASFPDSFQLDGIDFKDGASLDQAIFQHNLTIENTRSVAWTSRKRNSNDGAFFKGVLFISFALFANARFEQ